MGKKVDMESATQPKEFIIQHYRDLKASKDQMNANEHYNTISNSPLRKQIARLHLLWMLLKHFTSKLFFF